jgi:glucan phosphoethanolaminetransferase (alkaline phosphatase superfamily)
MPMLSLAAVVGVNVYTKGGTQVFPIPFGTFSNAAIVLATAPKGASAPQLDLDTAQQTLLTNSSAEIEGTIHPTFSKIVMIMDESVRGDYVSLNVAAPDTTPFLKATHHLVNFGVAISGGNCSVTSRTIFRFGMRQSDLPNRWREGLKRPTIWQFAHKAGYRIVRVNAWGHPPLQFHSDLSLGEEALIDSNIDVLENPSYLRDQLIVDEILAVLKDDKPVFIYVDKYGVHFPYSTKYPPEFQRFPAPVKSDSSIGAFLKNLLPPTGRGQTPNREIAVYPNAVTWSVDEFFRKLLPAVDLSKTLIIYTSDHGQNLLPGHITHCSTTLRVPRGEAYVPLFAITSASTFEQGLANGAARSFGRFSHFEIFPTLLLAMGYDADWVRRSYGPSLMDLAAAEQKLHDWKPRFSAQNDPSGS